MSHETSIAARRLLRAGRLFWGAVAVMGVCRMQRGRASGRRTPRDHLALLRNGLLIGWATIFLYSLALETNDVTPVIITLVGTSAVVELSIGVIDAAIKYADSHRSEIGSFQNRVNGSVPVSSISYSLNSPIRA